MTKGVRLGNFLNLKILTWHEAWVKKKNNLHPSDPKVHGDPEVHFEENRIFQHEAVYIFS